MGTSTKNVALLPTAIRIIVLSDFIIKTCKLFTVDQHYQLFASVFKNFVSKDYLVLENDLSLVMTSSTGSSETMLKETLSSLS